MLVSTFPCLYHMAEAGSWNSIVKHGLLSTTALLNLFEIEGDEREALESRHRPECVTVSHRRHGTAVIRDQKPMSDGGLQKALTDLSPREWYELLNKRVFFWLTRERLQTLLGARAYRDREHTVIVLDTAKLVRRYEGSISLSPMNSGCTKPFPHPRGSDTFQPIASFPYDERRKAGRRPDQAVVELAVENAVQNVREMAIRVESWKANTKRGVIWTPP